MDGELEVPDCWTTDNSGVARLGYTGACALATRGCTPPVQVCMRVIGADPVVVDPELGAKRVLKSNGAVSLCISPELQLSYTHRTRYCRVNDVHCTMIWLQNRPGRL